MRGPASTGSDRQTHHEARAQRLGGGICFGRPDVLGPDHAAVCLDDLLGDGEAEAGVVAEIALRARGVEPLEDLAERLFGNAGADRWPRTGGKTGSIFQTEQKKSKHTK